MTKRNTNTLPQSIHSIQVIVILNRIFITETFTARVVRKISFELKIFLMDVKKTRKDRV